MLQRKMNNKKQHKQDKQHTKRNIKLSKTRENPNTWGSDKNNHKTTKKRESQTNKEKRPKQQQRIFSQKKGPKTSTHGDQSTTNCHNIKTLSFL